MGDHSPRPRGGMRGGMRGLRGRGMRGGRRAFGAPFRGYGFPHLRKADDIKLQTKDDFIQRHLQSVGSDASEQDISTFSREYEAYVQDCRDKFFETHMRDGWLLDLYDPATLADLWERRAATARERAAALHAAHVSGALDGLTLDASEFEPVTSEDATAGDGAGWCCLSGVSPAVPHKVCPPCPPYSVIINAVPYSWTRRKMVEELKQLPGCAEMAISQPNRANYGRECVLTFNTKEGASNARMEIARMTICKKSVPAGVVREMVPDTNYPPPVMTAPAGFSDEEVMERDVEKLLRMCEFFDAEMEIPPNTAKETFSTADAESGGRTWDSLTVAQKVDRLVVYLRLTHNVCYYCAREFFDESEMHMMCGHIHLRAPSGTAGSDAKVAATQAGNAREIMEEIDKFIQARKKVDIPKVTGRLIRKEKSEKFCEENTKPVDDSVVSCLLCSKKFRGRNYVNNHIMLKHTDKLEKALEKDMNELLKNNYISDLHRIMPEADSSAAPVPLRPYKDLDSVDDTEAVNIYKSMFVDEEEEEEAMVTEGKETDMNDGNKEMNNEKGNNNNNGDDNDEDMK